MTQNTPVMQEEQPDEVKTQRCFNVEINICKELFMCVCIHMCTLYHKIILIKATQIQNKKYLYWSQEIIVSADSNIKHYQKTPKDQYRLKRT